MEFATFIRNIRNRPNIILPNLRNGSLLLNGIYNNLINYSPSRTTIVVERRYPVILHKPGNKPRLQRKTFHYILEENTECKPQPLVDIVLTSYVSGIGNPGDVLTMKKTEAYYKYLLLGLADYATPEALEYSREIKSNESIQKSQVSASVELCMGYLASRCFSIVMNKENEWTLEPWHVRASFRKAGVHILPNDSIELPKKPIRGPNLDLEGKEFYVTVTINKTHTVKCRCCIHHWSTKEEDRLPYVEDFWVNPGEQIFPEESSKQTTESGPA